MENSLAYFECEVKSRTDVGTHTAFVGEGGDTGIPKDGKPITGCMEILKIPIQ